MKLWYRNISILKLKSLALQVQQMWAQENNVTILGSGANNPREGSGGSGIFVGKRDLKVILSSTLSLYKQMRMTHK